MSTIKTKIGICSECTDGKEKPLTAKRCDFHYKKHRGEVNAFKTKKRAEMNAFLGNAPKIEKKKKPIPKVGAKRTKENKEYTIKKLQFLSLPENHRCFIERCAKRATTIEHTRGRQGYADDWARNNGITLFMDVRFWKGCCWDHNGELERNTELSQKYQLSKITGKKKLPKEPVNKL